MKTLSILLFSLFAIKSCENQNNSGSKNTEEIPTGTFKIIALAENDNLPDTLTIKFDADSNKVTGFSGCNRFFGSFKIDNKNVVFSGFGSTRKMCDNTANQIETQMLELLSKINSFSFENSILNLKTDNTTLIKAIPEK